MFCDLVDSTELSQRLDAEDLRSVVRGYQEAVGRTVQRYQGYVAQYLGDGLLVYFGYPQAHEDAAERAVRAGLEILSELRTGNDALETRHGIRLVARVGIHTGTAVVGAMGGGVRSEVLAVGETPNIAARAQGAAPPDAVVITAAVHDLVSGLFVVEDSGATRLKGVDKPIRLYRVVGAGVARRRLRGSGAHGLTPFVGRGDELHLLLGRWERAREGSGQVVLVTGEAGIGKSRLIDEFRAHIKPDPHLWIDCAGARLFEHTPFHAVTQMLGQGLGWRGDESSEERVRRLEEALQGAGLKLDEAAPLIAGMLDLPVPATYAPLLFAPEQRRKRLLASLAGWVFGASALQPLVLAIEDLHWVDPSTLEFLQILVEQCATSPLLLLCTARPEFRAPWSMRAHHVQVTLNRLDDRHTRAMIAGVAARAALAREMIDTVVKRTDGVPLFVEELTRLLLEDVTSGAREVPATLRDSLAARLDQFGRAKEVAQLGAVLGREFSYELLHAVSPLAEDELQAALNKLASAELLYVRGLPPDATYQFRHALVQDAAYTALLKSTRRDLHHRVAQVVVERFPALAEAQPEVLARHWTDAGEAEPAVAAWTRAAEAARMRVALKEAEEGYRQALATLRALPASPGRDAQELELTFALALVLFSTRGYNAPEVVEAVGQARSLAEKGGNLGQLVIQVAANCISTASSGDYTAAASLADQTLDLARLEGGETSFRLAHLAQLAVRYIRGDLVGAEEHFLLWRGISDARRYWQLPGATTHGMGVGGLCAWWLGRPDAARERFAHGLAFARESQSPYELAVGLYYESRLYACLREPERAEAAAAQAVAICDGHGFTQVGAFARIWSGWARAQLGRAGEGITLIGGGIACLAELGARIGVTDFLTRLAEAQALDGSIAEALATIERALTANPEEVLYRPCSLACRGELRLALGQSELAEADFREALEIARTMHAKVLELRAAMRLAGLLSQRGRGDEARGLLAGIYGSFTEGLDTRDLRDARALLDKLAA